MIVKVQISLYTSESERQVLVMDEPRDTVIVLPLSTCIGLEAAMQDTAPVWRAFFEAEIIGGLLSLGRRMPEQDW